ncbi:SAM-dependent methyltransferase [Kibdelosporangium banguiense]|uniref:SAM-dependent methyltransferase n=1 Tax=Kibdelosporangium banguiense TaxID=1365924 RepID=A0ABS4TNZ3_9PSEU|nr:class I SAM-dependent methyltransferase [Kibdelosporangium banguiense]MBP2326128.1 SAM-dependent methyltransferase [Kibdelosporangium banguiense]
MSTLDWSLGEFEGVAPQLLPAAQTAIELAGLSSGQHVVDVGCGTGNAALLAAQHPGVRVTGVDPAPRLLEVARAAAAARGLDADFVSGDAANVPLPDGSADVVLSVFAVIFAPDPAVAAAELARITAPDGKIVVAAWIPEGAVMEAMKVLVQAIGEASGSSVGPSFEWYEPAQAAGLFEPHGFDVAVHERSLAFQAPDVESYWQASFVQHPLMVATTPLLEAHGLLAGAQASARAILVEGNESPDAFKVTSRYVVITASR